MMATLTLFRKPVDVRVLGAGFVVLALIAYFPYLWSGFSADDVIFINMIEGSSPYDHLLGFWAAPADSFVGLSSLWWAELDSVGAFLRPLASWVFTLLYWVLGRNAAPFHAVLIVTHGLVAYTAFLIFRRLSGRDAPALLGGMLFLVCEDHGMTVAWIATMTDLLCALFLNLAFLSHVTARMERRRGLFVLSLALFLAALASKESAAMYPLLVAAYEFFFAGVGRSDEHPPTLARRFGLWISRWQAWAIPLALFAGYMVLYRSLLPPMQSLVYRDPFSHPGAYLLEAAVNLPVLYVALLSQVLPSVALMVPGLLGILAIVGVILIALFLWALSPYRREPTLWFALAAFTLGLLPGLGTDVGERLLYVPSVYGLYLVAWLILQLPRFRSRFVPDSPERVPFLGVAWGRYLFISAGVLPVLLLFVYPWMWIPGMQIPGKSMRESLPFINPDRAGHVVYLNTSSSFNTFYLADMYRFERGDTMDVRILSSFNGRVWARQESARVITLKTDHRGWLTNMFARVVRTTREFHVGDMYTTPLFDVTILATTRDNRDVYEVMFSFSLPLDDPSLVLLCYDGRAYRRWVPTPAWDQLTATIDPFGF